MDQALQTHLRDFLADDQRREAALISSGYQGSAYLFQNDGVRLVVKQAGSGLLAGWFHQLMLQREARVYKQLADVHGVPHSPGFLDKKWLLLEFVEGSSLKAERHNLQNREQFFLDLRKIIDDCHQAGVAHGDLKRKDNILLDKQQHPFLIDFGTAVLRDGGLLDRLLYPLFVRFDRNAWIKAKYRFDTHKITPEDLNWYAPTWVENAFRQVRRFWRTVTFRQARNRRRNKTK
ncbi:MAG: protein kinase domain-containing protein [Gammaproteobacteria bacterium]